MKMVSNGIHLARVNKPHSSPYVPVRFASAIFKHLYRNHARLSGPLYFAVHGPAGEGKSFGIRVILEQLGVKSVRLSGGLMESAEAGEPAQRIRDAYLAANRLMSGSGATVRQPVPAVLILEDVDASLGDWGDNVQYTVNRQTTLAELMHLADDPETVDGRKTRRVPVIFTGNNLSRLYCPLLRAGRMTLLEWQLRPDERALVVSGIFPELSLDEARALAAMFARQSVAFFSDLRVRMEDDCLIAAMTGKSPRAVLQEALLGRRLAMSAVNVTLERVMEMGRSLETSRQLINHLERAE